MNQPAERCAAPVYPADDAFVGPILYLQGADAGRLRLAALIVTSAPSTPALRTAEGTAASAVVHTCHGRRVVRYHFDLPARRDAWYEVDGVRYDVNADFDGDLDIAFVSCNGEETGDQERRRTERNALWRRLGEQHARRPFQLLLLGGDQIYADELLKTHPLLRAWADPSDETVDDPGEAALAEVADTLQEGFFQRYLDVLGQPETMAMTARIPSLAMWDDHDICDGWGSISPQRLDSPVGRIVFAIARQNFLLFQLGAAPGELPPICTDPTGGSLSWHVRLPGLHVLAPDLRSERRPDRVMGDGGWKAMEAGARTIEDGRVLLVSSVPALGPRLSWLEAAALRIPGMQRYEDDLRDQWQSRAHRAEWRRFLECLAAIHEKARVTVLSGEIHLATRATFDAPGAPIHQLVASGIVHPAPPRAYGATLALLARFGQTPVPGRSIRMRPLPGRRGVYTSQRNYLILERRQDRWRTYWELEKDGRTPMLDL